MVYDLIPFFNEVDILTLRLHILDPYVDRFVIEEATTTFSGQRKDLCFDRNRELFSEFMHKIEYIVVDEDRDFAATHERDYFQKNHLSRGIADASDRDMIIFGDCDEIPDPRAIERIRADFDSDRVYHLAQRNFYAYLNMEEVSGSLLSITGEFPEIADRDRRWLGTKICGKKSIPVEGIVRLRDLISPCDARSVRVPDGGWHFGYMGGHGQTDVLERIGIKLSAAAHQEYNNAETIREARSRLALGLDPLGRDARFARVEIDESYPSYLLEHLEDYRHLIMPSVSSAEKFLMRADLTVGRFARRAVRKLTRIMKG